MSVSVSVQLIVPQGTHTQADVESYPRLFPLIQVTAFTTTDIEHVRARRTLSSTCKFANEDGLDPVVELLQADDRGELPILNTDFRSSVVCACER